MIRELLREAIVNKLMKESNASEHLFDRLKQRINMLSDDEISSEEKEFLSKYLNILLSLDFDKSKSFGVKLLDLNVNKNSDMYYEINGREYYRIDDFLGKDSTGNEIWLIIRNNRAITIMLRKDIQPISKLRVNYVINDISELQNTIKNGLVK